MKSAISELVEKLKDQGKDVLAETIYSYADMSIKDYSKKLWSYEAMSPMEDILKKAFEKELTRLDVPKEAHPKIISSLDKYRSIQTAPHTGFLDSSRLLTAHLVAINSLPEGVYYVCATFSGVPFANDSYPCALTFDKKYSFKEILSDENLIKEAERKQKDRERDLGDDGYNRLSLYPAKSRDMIVYKSETNEVYEKYFPHFKSPLKEILIDEHMMTKNMLIPNQKLLSNIFPDKKIIVIDINEVVSNYLEEALKDSGHFMYKMFFDEKLHTEIINTFSTDEHFFYHSNEDGTKEYQEHAYIENLVLKSRSINEEITPEILIDKLKNTKLCPGIFIGFTIFSFLNEFQCFGGFKQVGYLSRYKKIWMDTMLLPKDIKHVVTNALTTGGVPIDDIKNTTPLDILFGSKWNPDVDQKFGEYILSIEKVLLAFKN